METRQERYRRRTIFKAGWFDTMNAERQRIMRVHIDRMKRKGAPPEQEALFPFFLSHPMADHVFEIEMEREGGSWIGFDSEEYATLALVAFRTFSSAPACFQYLTNSGCGAATEDSELFARLQKDIEAVKELGLWVTE